VGGEEEGGIGMGVGGDVGVVELGGEGVERVEV